MAQPQSEESELTLQELLDRLGNREDVTLTSKEWVSIAKDWDAEAWRHGLEPTTKLCFLNAGIVAWLLPNVTGRDRPVRVRMPEIEGLLNEPSNLGLLAQEIEKRRSK